jgi:hypothetical protein
MNPSAQLYTPKAFRVLPRKVKTPYFAVGDEGTTRPSDGAALPREGKTRGYALRRQCSVSAARGCFGPAAPTSVEGGFLNRRPGTLGSTNWVGAS